MSSRPIHATEAPLRGFSSFIRHLSGWQWLTVAVALLVVVPLTVLLLAWLEPAWGIWQHLRETLLSRLLVNTFKLVTGVTAVLWCWV